MIIITITAAVIFCSCLIAGICLLTGEYTVLPATNRTGMETLTDEEFWTKASSVAATHCGPVVEPPVIEIPATGPISQERANAQLVEFLEERDYNRASAAEWEKWTVAQLNALTSAQRAEFITLTAGARQDFDFHKAMWKSARAGLTVIEMVEDIDEDSNTQASTVREVM